MARRRQSGLSAYEERWLKSLFRWRPSFGWRALEEKADQNPLIWQPGARLVQLFKSTGKIKIRQGLVYLND